MGGLFRSKILCLPSSFPTPTLAYCTPPSSRLFNFIREKKGTKLTKEEPISVCPSTLLSHAKDKRISILFPSESIARRSLIFLG